MPRGGDDLEDILLEEDTLYEDSELIIRPDGTREIYNKDKLLHSTTEPAKISPDGTEEWFINGIRDREGDAPAIIRPDGTKEFYKKGKRHREGGPAIIHSNGDKEWFWEDQLHRLGAPAKTWVDGRGNTYGEIEEYWEYGKPRSPEKGYFRLDVNGTEIYMEGYNERLGCNILRHEIMNGPTAGITAFYTDKGSLICQNFPGSDKMEYNGLPFDKMISLVVEEVLGDLVRRSLERQPVRKTSKS